MNCISLKSPPLIFVFVALSVSLLSSTCSSIVWSRSGYYPKLPRVFLRQPRHCLCDSSPHHIFALDKVFGYRLHSFRLLTPRIARPSMPHSDPSSSPVRDTSSELPTFPDNVPTAPLLRISLEKLLHHDEEEHELCWKACCDLGFFYLDLRTSSGQSIDGDALLQDADRLFEVMKGFYDLDVQEKVKYDFKDQGSYFGYKGYGEGVIDKEGTRDRNEFYNVRSYLRSVKTRVLICVNTDLQRRRP
jgi:hypothetical protein